MTDDLYFQDTCEIFDVSTCTGAVLNERLIDPCNCYNYYQCSNSYTLIKHTCSPGTAWDYNQANCVHFQDVIFYQPCADDNVWTRCNTTESRLEELRYICTNETGTTVTTQTSTTVSEAVITDKINPGIIVGSIIGGALIAVIVLIIVFVLYRRQKQNRLNKKRQGTIAHNPEYFEGPDDPYAIIRDEHVISDGQMSDPTYNGSIAGGTMNQSNGSCTNVGFDGEEDTVYDNSGERIVGTGYTSTIRRSIRDYETPAGASSSRVESQTDAAGSHATPNLYVDLRDSKNRSSNGDQSEMAGNELSSGVDPGASGHVTGHTDDDTPNYVILEKTDT